jgi:hypothetical protein
MQARSSARTHCNVVSLRMLLTANTSPLSLCSA